MNKLAGITVAVALLAGCATRPGGINYAPLTDLKPGQNETYMADLQACQAYAAQKADAADGAATGAVVGAVALGLMSVIIGGGGHGRWAAVGALSGAAEGAVVGEEGQRNVIRRCMAGRGYSVLD